MKKCFLNVKLYIGVLLGVLVCACVSGAPAASVWASAAEPDVQEAVTMELSRSEIYLPQPKVHGLWNYTIDVFSADDARLDAPLASNVIKYAFAAPGSYILKYTFVSGKNSLIKTSELTVADSKPPKLTAVEKFPKAYRSGEPIRLAVKVSDNGELSAVTVRLFAGGKDITQAEKITSKLHADDTGRYIAEMTLRGGGTYRAVVTAKDASGNAAEIGFDFTVDGGGMPVWAIVLIAAGGAAVLAGAAVITIVRWKRKGKKNDEA